MLRPFEEKYSWPTRLPGWSEIFKYFNADDLMEGTGSNYEFETHSLVLSPAAALYGTNTASGHGEVMVRNFDLPVYLNCPLLNCE